MSLAVLQAQHYGSYTGFANLGDVVNTVVKTGTRVSFRGSVYDVLSAVPFVTQAQLDAIRGYVEQGEYRDVRVSSNYSYVTIEATLGRDKTSLNAIRDNDFRLSVLYGYNSAGSVLLGTAGATAVRDLQINITQAPPAVIAPRIPNPQPPSTGGGNTTTTPPGQPQTIWDYLGISNPFGAVGSFGAGATLATIAFVILALKD